MNRYSRQNNTSDKFSRGYDNYERYTYESIKKSA